MSPSRGTSMTWIDAAVLTVHSECWIPSVTKFIKFSGDWAVLELIVFLYYNLLLKQFLTTTNNAEYTGTAYGDYVL